MKRFYCTTCKRLKRVRKLPKDIETPNAEIPSDRIGNCDWHSRSSVTSSKPGAFDFVKKMVMK